MLRKILVICILAYLLISLCNFVQASQPKVVIRVMAAASLTEVFSEIKTDFEKKNSDIELEFNFAGSQELAGQIEQGVNADIFASANMKYMEQLSQINLVEKPEIFAHNSLVIGVYKGAKNVNSVGDLIKSGVKLCIADPSVPVGKYALEMLDKIDKWGKFGNYKKQFLANVLTQELNVKSVVQKIELGEVDAGIIYRTDLTSANKNKIRIIDIDDNYNVNATYPIAILKNSTHKKESGKFIAYLLSKTGKKKLEKYGFDI